MSMYTIQPGDTLGQIAKRMNTTIEAIKKANLGLKSEIKNINRIYAGAKIRLPEIESRSDMDRYMRNVAKKTEERKPQPAEATMNPRQRAMLSRREGTPTESRSLMSRSRSRSRRSNIPSLKLNKQQQKEFLAAMPNSYTPDVLGLTRKGLESLGVNVDPFVVAFNQAKLSVAERVLGPDSEVVKSLAKPITEKELGNPVVKALRDGTIRMFREGKDMLTYKAQGTNRPGDIFETGFSGLIDALSPSRAASLVSGDTRKGKFTLDADNNLILNDTYDFPDVSEYQAYEGPNAGLYLKIHNMFEPRGTTGKEGITSGLFAVSPENTRKIAINLGKAPQDIVNMIQSQNQMYASTGSSGMPAG